MALPNIQRNKFQPAREKSIDDFVLLEQNENFIAENINWNQALEERLIANGLLTRDTEVNLGIFLYTSTYFGYLLKGFPPICQTYIYAELTLTSVKPEHDKKPKQGGIQNLCPAIYF